MLIEELSPTVALNHRDRHGIDNLVGRKALTARGTFATALNARAVLRGTGVENSRICEITNGTLHF